MVIHSQMRVPPRFLQQMFQKIAEFCLSESEYLFNEIKNFEVPLLYKTKQIYACEREELRIGPFTYEPMRAVDIWLQQADDFILQNLHVCPEVAPQTFVHLLRQALKRIKQDPYPSVSIFGTNNPRVYRMDEISGHWVRVGKDPDNWGPPAVTSLPQQHNFKQEPIPSWPPLPVQSQIYY